MSAEHKPLRIAVVWEQQSWGGAGTNLKYLFDGWAHPTDSIDLYVNAHNEGLDRLRDGLTRHSFLSIVEVKSLFIRQRHPKEGRRWSRRLGHYLTPVYLIAMTRRYQRLLAGKGYDAIIAVNGGYPAAWGTLAAVLGARRAGVPCRILLVNHAATKPLPFMSNFCQVVDRAVAKATTTIVAISKATRLSIQANTWLTQNENVDLRVIYCGVPLEHGIPSEDDGIHDRLSPAPGFPKPHMVGIVGRIERYKGHEDAIAALSLLDPVTRAQFHLVIIGDGAAEYVHSLRQLSADLGVSEQVQFLGYVRGSSAAAIAQLDLLIVATRSFEGFGLTLAEAMTVGVPVLATRVGAIPEFVDDDCGCLVEPGSPGQMAAALHSFHRDREAWIKRACLAKARVQQFGNQAMAAEYRALILRTLAVTRR